LPAEDVNEVVKDLKNRIGAVASALVSRDGLVLSADVPDGVYTETFAIMCATILGAAATANTELSRAPPAHIVVEGPDSKTLIVGSGKKALLVAVVDHDTDTQNTLKELEKVAELVKTG
jgi:hypothetical protein